jgi:7,8-dihydropterin-6-yl-methyl-4-(beta-D-ribofuranosyl)aminobenzene 5'-phosphate synthase
MRGKITVICENSVAPGRPGIGEHGFAALLETERGNYLFDTGKGEGLIGNLLAFDKDPLSIQKIILSHGHPDHTGGLAAILDLLGEVEVLAHPDIFMNRFLIKKSAGREEKRFAGLKFQRAYLESLGARFNLERGFREITGEIYLSGEIPRRNPFETGDPRLFAEVGGKLLPDPFPDDQSIFIRSPLGLVVLLGCAHSGTINIIEHAFEKTGADRIYAVFGGTHLDFSSPAQMEETIRTLKKYGIAKIGVSHCTGPKAAARLYHEFGDKFVFGQVGEALEF